MSISVSSGLLSNERKQFPVCTVHLQQNLPPIFSVNSQILDQLQITSEVNQWKTSSFTLCKFSGLETKPS
jgi:hypothetical protein